MVWLADNTGEDPHRSTNLSFNCVRFIPYIFTKFVRVSFQPAEMGFTVQSSKGKFGKEKSISDIIKLNVLGDEW